MSSHASVESLLSRIRDWWRRQNELVAVLTRGAGEGRRRIGRECQRPRGFWLRGVMTRQADPYERMHALDLSKADVGHAATDVLRDLQRTCACCNEKGRCEKDLLGPPESPLSGGGLLSQCGHVGHPHETERPSHGVVSRLIPNLVTSP